tara:strand:- start:1768 stop:2358 length:591 start_codon:yes stop_codon:yes gene_type:complete
MVRLYTDEQSDENCKDYRPVPLKLYRVVYGLEGKGTNPLTNTKSDRMLALPSGNINLATKSNLRLNAVPASVVQLRYNELYNNVVVEGKKLNTEIDIETPKPTSAPADNPEEERPPPNEAPETEIPEKVISTFVDPATGEVEELIEPAAKSVPKPDAKRRNLLPVPEEAPIPNMGKGVSGVQGQTDASKKGQKVIM